MNWDPIKDLSEQQKSQLYKQFQGYIKENATIFRRIDKRFWREVLDVNKPPRCSDETDARNLRILVGVLATLTPREEQVIRRMFKINRTKENQQKAGDYFGVTQPRISQIKMKAITKLRHRSRSNPLKACLPGD